MKKFLLSAAAAFIAGGALYAGEAEFKFDKAADWKSSTPIKWVGKESKTIEVTGPATLLSAKKFDIDHKKYYKLEADVKQISGTSIPVCVGFKVFDKNDKEIFAYMVNARIGSETTVVKAVKPGDKVMIVKANPQWKAGTYAVALNAKKDLSDLPSYDTLLISNITPKGQELEIQLKAPAPKAVPAGTVVRAHYGGGYMYTAGYKVMKAGESVELKGTARGAAKHSMTSGCWAPGAVKAQVILLVNWKWGVKEKLVAQIKDVELEIK